MYQPKSGIWPAKDLYTSKRFTSTKNNLDQSGQPWFILSTAHGLIAPNDLKEHYDRSLDSFDRSKVLSWALKVRDNLLTLKTAIKEITYYTGNFRQIIYSPLSDLLQKLGVNFRQG
jgi:hypothetical protein